MINIHKSITDKLNKFISVSKIPNIIFHGPSGSGKKTLLDNFIQNIYKTKENIKKYTLYVNCAHGKGIKFIRDELKFFSKSHINSNGGQEFKSIILWNADKLTIDAQSALRRCIELFSHNTRFFICVENKYQLLKPILSRFCEIYVYYPIINNNHKNLYHYNITKKYENILCPTKYVSNIKKEIKKEKDNITDINKLINFSIKLYEKGYSALNIFSALEDNTFLSKELNVSKRYELLLMFNKIKKDFRNEKLLILFTLNFIIFGLDYKMENITFM